MKTIYVKLCLSTFCAILGCTQVFSQTSNSKAVVKNEDTLFVTKPELGTPLVTCMTPPEGFVVSEAFNGYIHFQTNSTILMQSILGANYFQLSSTMNEDFFKRNNLRFVSEEKVVCADGTEGICYRSNFTLETTEFVRLTIYIGDLNNTLWLNITYPVMVQSLVEKPIQEAIVSINFKQAFDEE